VDAMLPRNMYVTNGTSVMRTKDSGCSFKQVFALPDAPSLESQATAANSVIRSIDVSEAANGLIYLMVEESLPTSTRPHVIVSGDFGDSWRAADLGLPPNGAPEFLTAAPSNERIAYLGIDLGGGSLDHIYATNDAGLTWTLRSDIADSKPNAGVLGLTIDPIDAESLWAYGTSTPPNGTGQSSGREASGLLHSTDGGRTFQNVDDFGQTPAGPVDVFHARGKPARIVAFIPGQGVARISTDSGNTWAAIPAPPGVDSVAHGETIDSLFVTAAGEVHAFHGPSFSWINLGAYTPGLAGVQSDRMLHRVYAHSKSTLEMYDGTVEFDEITELPKDIFNVSLVQGPNSPTLDDPSLSPQRKTIALDAGDSATVRYHLDLPDRPLPLNVFFLLDTSDSMGSTIEDLADAVADITNDLLHEQIDLKVGIGAFRAYPDKFPPDPPCGAGGGPGRCEKNYVFERVLQIGPPGPHVSTALETLESDSGGYFKAHLGALYQLATGAGQDLFPPGPAGHDVPQGLQAEWDKKALKVVVHATDERFGREEPRQSSGADFGNPEPPDIPSFDQVAAAFDRPGTLDDIYQVGLSIGSGPRKDLQRMAALTNTVAPSEGVDCNGDGFAELSPGAPLVCDVKRDNLDDSHNLVPAIVNTLQAIPKTTNVSLEVKGNKEVIRDVSPEVHRDVVEQIANELVYEVEYRCPLSMAGKKFPIELQARNSLGRLLDSGTTKILCQDIDDPPVPPVVLVALLPPIPPPPPPPVSQLTSSTQAQGQAQAQAGAAYQEEEQPQVAVAAAYKEMLEQRAAMEYEMVAYERRRYPVPPMFVLGTGLILGACAYGVAMAREKAQVARQRR